MFGVLVPMSYQFAGLSMDTIQVQSWHPKGYSSATLKATSAFLKLEACCGYELHMASCGASGFVQLWRCSDWRREHEVLDKMSDHQGCSFSPDGLWLLTVGRTLVIWQVVRQPMAKALGKGVVLRVATGLRLGLQLHRRLEAVGSANRPSTAAFQPWPSAESQEYAMVVGTGDGVISLWRHLEKDTPEAAAAKIGAAMAAATTSAVQRTLAHSVRRQPGFSSSLVPRRVSLSSCASLASSNSTAVAEPTEQEDEASRMELTGWPVEEASLQMRPPLLRPPRLPSPKCDGEGIANDEAGGMSLSFQGSIDWQQKVTMKLRTRSHSRPQLPRGTMASTVPADGWKGLKCLKGRAAGLGHTDSASSLPEVQDNPGRFHARRSSDPFICSWIQGRASSNPPYRLQPLHP
ncbi:unnamed protein product [Polarella glacialis]|uniref:Uncharacterized protein n=1 Tax=Polarella glacialis TaxID=89957 RepID=A0A813ITU8_POLGL|nr:unnamed protein product [Polarella glacialis]